jgi:hypothetical protein
VASTVDEADVLAWIEAKPGGRVRDWHVRTWSRVLGREVTASRVRALLKRLVQKKRLRLVHREGLLWWEAPGD